MSDASIGIGAQTVRSRTADAKGSCAHLILNPAAGFTADFMGRLTGAARERGILVRVLEPGEDAKLAALEAVEDGAKSLAVAGGDGSVAAVAGVAVERDLPLAVVPTGTLNHFARDLGLDLARPLRALAAFDAGHERRVDVGRINGGPFINNVSLGVYAQMLADPGYRRDKLRVAQTKLQGAVFDPVYRGVEVFEPLCQAKRSRGCPENHEEPYNEVGDPVGRGSGPLVRGASRRGRGPDSG